MTTAATLQETIKSYLRHTSLERMTLRSTLDLITKSLPEYETLIFGGLLRDFALKNVRWFNSDIDLVSLASEKEIGKAIERFSPTRNKFGGYRFCVQRHVFDIWSFKDTWAFREGLVEAIEITDLLKTTFFNVDASAYSLSTESCYMTPECAHALTSKTLDINLAANPSPNRMAHRAIRLAIRNGFSIERRLAHFLIDNYNPQFLDQESCDFMIKLEQHVSIGNSEPFRFQPKHPQNQLPF